MLDLRAIAAVVPSDVFIDISVACANDAEFICGACDGGKRGLDELLVDYGLDDDEPTMYGITKDMTPIQRVCSILDNAHGWGEFLGGVLCVFPHLPDEQRATILPHLAANTKHAAEHGVDH